MNNKSLFGYAYIALSVVSAVVGFGTLGDSILVGAVLLLIAAICLGLGINRLLFSR